MLLNQAPVARSNESRVGNGRGRSDASLSENPRPLLGRPIRAAPLVPRIIDMNHRSFAGNPLNEHRETPDNRATSLFL